MLALSSLCRILNTCLLLFYLRDSMYWAKKCFHLLFTIWHTSCRFLPFTQQSLYRRVLMLPAGIVKEASRESSLFFRQSLYLHSKICVPKAVIIQTDPVFTESRKKKAACVVLSKVPCTGFCYGFKVKCGKLCSHKTSAAGDSSLACQLIGNGCLSRRDTSSKCQIKVGEKNVI